MSEILISQRSFSIWIWPVIINCHFFCRVLELLKNDEIFQSNIIDVAIRETIFSMPYVYSSIYAHNCRETRSKLAITTSDLRQQCRFSQWKHNVNRTFISLSYDVLDICPGLKVINCFHQNFHHRFKNAISGI